MSRSMMLAAQITRSACVSTSSSWLREQRRTESLTSCFLHSLGRAPIHLSLDRQGTDQVAFCSVMTAVSSRTWPAEYPLPCGTPHDWAARRGSEFEGKHDGAGKRCGDGMRMFRHNRATTAFARVQSTAVDAIRPICPTLTAPPSRDQLNRRQISTTPLPCLTLDS